MRLEICLRAVTAALVAVVSARVCSLPLSTASQLTSRSTISAVAFQLAAIRNITTSLADADNSTIWATFGILTSNVSDFIVEVKFAVDLILSKEGYDLPEGTVAAGSDMLRMHPQNATERAVLKEEKSIVRHIILGLEFAEDALDSVKMTTDIVDGYGHESRAQTALDVARVVIKTGKLFLKVLQVLPTPRPPPANEDGNLVVPSKHHKDEDQKTPLSLLSESIRGAAAVPNVRTAAATHPHTLSWKRAAKAGRDHPNA